jgi:DNA-binding transcriptional regulator/RsmH inhibitor MraZ
MLKGSSTASMDRWGRVSIPSDFLKTFKEKFGNEVFVTSTDDRNLQIYPLAAWFELVDNLYKEKKDDPLLSQFLMKTNYNGQRARIDRYGSIQIHSFLMKKIKLEGKINIEGREDHLELMPEHM